MTAPCKNTANDLRASCLYRTSCLYTHVLIVHYRIRADECFNQRNADLLQTAVSRSIRFTTSSLLLDVYILNNEDDNLSRG